MRKKRLNSLVDLGDKSTTQIEEIRQEELDASSMDSCEESENVFPEQNDIDSLASCETEEGQNEVSFESASDVELREEEFITNPTTGLTPQEVEERVSDGRVNGKINIRTKSYAQIFKTNLCTLFNLLNLVLVVLVIAVGHSWKNASFVGPAIINVIIGIVQEIRAKKTIDKLSLISAPKVIVIRDSVETEIKVEEIVKDDIMLLKAGNQICSDCKIIDGNIEVDESLITGESDPITKKAGDVLLSGSYIVSGNAVTQVIHIGMDNYANKISSGAKYIKATNSDILRSLRAVVRLMSIVVVPLGVVLFVKSYLSSKDLAASTIKMVSSMSSMIPQGLIALTSTVFAIGVIRLSKHKTLSQDLYCIETLARVDVLCLDKTGTITEGTMQVNAIVQKNNYERRDIDKALMELVTIVQDKNPTSMAIRDRYSTELSEMKRTLKPSFIAPFSSARKWSGISIDGVSYIMGAPEFVFKVGTLEFKDDLDYYASQGERVLVLAHSNKVMTDNVLPEDLSLMALIVIGDKIRVEAPDTLKFFADQNVDIRIISGDSPVTVSAIAKKAGLSECDWIDMSTVSDEQILEVSRKYKVFGRVTPDQKLRLVKALKSDGHTVAMTGDGVNDVLALKEADCSIAMASGSDAARNCAQLVLLDSNFASMPKIVAEGRRSINNLQRSASLYLVKTIYSALLTLLFIFISYPFPFESTNITLVGAATIGIPSFLLALEPNEERVKGKFLQNAMAKALPSALSIVVSVGVLQLIRLLLSNVLGFTLEDDQMTTVSVVLLACGAFVELFVVCKPFDTKHTLLFIGMIAVFMLGWWVTSMDLVFPGQTEPINIFSMTPIDEITEHMWIYMGISVGASIPVFILVSFLVKKYSKFSNSKLLKKLDLS